MKYCTRYVGCQSYIYFLIHKVKIYWCWKTVKMMYIEIMRFHWNIVAVTYVNCSLNMSSIYPCYLLSVLTVVFQIGIKLINSSVVFLLPHLDVKSHVSFCNHLFLARLAFRPCELLSSLFVRRPSVNISHFNLLLRNHRTNCNQTLVEWSLDGPLPKLCQVIPTSNQDGRQAQNRKKGGWNFNCPLLL